MDEQGIEVNTAEKILITCIFKCDGMNLNDDQTYPQF